MTKVALAQFTGNADIETNFKTIERMVGEAVKRGAQVVCLPELCTTIYFCFERNERHRELAEGIPGPSFDRASQLARRHGVVLVFPIYERAGDRFYNTAAVIGTQGELVGKYRKNSLPRIPRNLKPGDTPSDEQFYFEPGDLGFPVFDTPFGITFGILICYDRHFPEAARVLALKGAQLILVPSSSYRDWMREVWEVELRAHAVMNNVFVAGVNKVGVDFGGSPGRPHFGSSVAFGPMGELLARASRDQEECIYIDVDRSVVEDKRDLWGCFSQRRPEAYLLVTKPIVETARETR